MRLENRTTKDVIDGLNFQFRFNTLTPGEQDHVCLLYRSFRNYPDGELVCRQWFLWFSFLRGKTDQKPLRFAL